MARMVRKQIYIEPEQDELLKRRSREAGVSEAEMVRRCIERLEHGVPRGQATELDAWDETLAFIKKHRIQEVSQAGRQWTREEIYDERLKRLSR